MKTVGLEIDVAAATGLAAPTTLAASLYLPDDLGAKADLLVCLHGGGYTRAYWDPPFAGPDYSFARDAAYRGRAVLTLDLLGMGASSRPEPESLLSRGLIAAASDNATREVVEGLEAGRWGVSVTDVSVTVIGHSIGGMMAITQADQFGGFDRLAVLGWANQPMVLHDMDAATLAGVTLPVGYIPTPRPPMRKLFYWPDVPQGLIEADEAAGSTTPSCLGRDALTPGIVHEASARITCPVFLMHGEIDTSPDPHGEVAFFKASPDVTLMVLERTAHCHNFARLRHCLWDRLDAWVTSTPT